MVTSHEILLCISISRLLQSPTRAIPQMINDITIAPSIISPCVEMVNLLFGLLFVNVKNKSDPAGYI